MNCYSCESFSLKPVKLDYGLPARECHKCKGVHIDLLSYRSWREDYAGKLETAMKNTTDTKVEQVTATDNKKALICKRCSKFMLKYKVSTEHDNFVDICTSCDDAWLDGGEWQLLKQLQLAGKLTHITTEPWQRNIRAEAVEKTFQQSYQSKLGDVDFNKLQDMCTWIEQHPEKQELLKYMRITFAN
ncbi:MAG: hypothetical protein HRU06_09050 [Oceanospirillaceae bacterium]|nr:hypothetical protein [Oceanospirillaceae bacterium]